MVIPIILDVLRNNELSVSDKIKTLRRQYAHYKNLNKALKNETIFIQNLKQDESFKRLVNKFTDSDFVLLNKLFHKDVKKYLISKKLKKNLNFIEKDDFIQVGQGFILNKEPVLAIWTTGTGFVYLPTKLNSKNHIKIELFSIPPLTVEIGFEGQKVKKIEMPTLSYKNVKISIDSSKINDVVSEFYFKTDKLWKPNIIVNRDESKG